MRTREIHRLVGGSGDPFNNLVNSKLGDKFLADAERREDELWRKAEDSRLRQAIPHSEAVKRAVADRTRRDLLASDVPAVHRADAASIALHMSNADPRDAGLRRAALYLRKIWERDPDGTLTIADLAKARRRFATEFPRSAARHLFDVEIPQAGFQTLDVRKLARVASEISTQDDYDRLIVAYGLDGADARSSRARSYIRALVNKRAQDGACEHKRMITTPDGIVCAECGVPADQIDKQGQGQEFQHCPGCGGAQHEPSEGCELCMIFIGDNPDMDPQCTCDEALAFEQDAKKPPSISEETMHELKDKEERGEIDDAYAIAWSIHNKNKGGSRVRADAPDAGEIAWHPDVETDRDDAVKVKDGEPKGGRRGQKPSKTMPAVPPQSPEESEFKPGVNQQQPDQINPSQSDAELKAEGRRRRRGVDEGALREEIKDLEHTVDNVQSGLGHLEEVLDGRNPEASTEGGPPVGISGLARRKRSQAVVESDDPADVELAENVEKLVTDHVRENAPAEAAEARGGRKVKISRIKVEDHLLDGKTVRIGGYALRIASVNGVDHIAMAGPRMPEMFWPMRKLTAAVEYYSSRAERVAQSMIPSKINDQQPDTTQVPADLGPNSSDEDVDSLEPSSVNTQTDAQSQPGTSRSDFEGTATDDQNVSWSSVEPIQQGWEAAGTSDSLDGSNPLGPHTSDDEPQSLEPGVEPSSKRARKIASIRAALRGE